MERKGIPTKQNGNYYTHQLVVGSCLENSERTEENEKRKAKKRQETAGERKERKAAADATKFNLPACPQFLFSYFFFLSLSLSISLNLDHLITHSLLCMPTVAQAQAPVTLLNKKKSKCRQTKR